MPYRVSTRTKAQALAAPENDVHINIGVLWRQLTVEGWTVKRPMDLATSWSYLTPEAANEERIEGVNMFVREAAVVMYAAAKGIVGGVVVDGDMSDEYGNVTASQIDTTVALSANTVYAMFDGDSIKEEGTAVTIISLAAVLESPTPPSPPSRIANGPIAPEPMTPTTPVPCAVAAYPVIPLVPLNPDDVNSVKVEDVADDYESMCSSSEGDSSSDEDHVAPRDIDDEIASDEVETSLMDADLFIVYVAR
ncbi:hypothetical protein PF005_g7229 [Phytophthora fragariae]|uniref:Uncharacterized protein n=2 Tax=Phytophthora fragariae TaxID=53985 RepID=A0A6A3ST17_9STRA|nr:hypothetical protein PF009_g7547 [Phytophthora fragariae]KAE9019588.1 hypothetical protein PF011_g5769 [Phytophthora fragariae]KAE9122895.1 hypothetical protein PF007_g7269 [Phytophthora fragariae]KAE9149269.1 hypothetical protein PF006_g6234 [Phytophthora fragariae]KAE9221101.1 hypothetical protein PF005_g7229 [Phytophthora fragariae]